MTHFFTRSLLLLGLCTLLYHNSPAQVARNRNKTANPHRNNYQRIAAGNDAKRSFEIRNGALWAYGDNTYGELGDGTTVTKYSPVQIGSATNWVSVACGYHHTVGIRSDGTLWAWGVNGNGQLGDGTYTDRLTPIQVPGAGWVCAAGGADHTMAVKSDGTLWGWGYNYEGELGNGGTVQTNTPGQVSGTGWASVTCGDLYTVALKSNGTLWAWGGNGAGQLGDGSTTEKHLPVQVPGTAWAAIVAGDAHTLALKSDGTLWAWGSNLYGQLGDGTSAAKSSPVQIAGTTWTSISAGSYHSIALKADGTLWAWGYNAYGEVGDGSTVNKNIPTQAPGTGWVSIAGGYYHTLAAKSDGTVWAWGRNDGGQLGDGTGSGKVSPTSTQKALAQWLTAVNGAGDLHAIRGDGTLWACGRNNYQELGDGTAVEKHVPVQIGSDNKWVALASGNYHTLGLKSDGTLWAWGYNDYGNLGDATLTTRSAPVQIGSDNDWVSIACGSIHSVALKSNGTLWAWGFGLYGQLGNNSTASKSIPTQITTAGSWVACACSGFSTFALGADGKVWNCGFNGNGELGNGNTTDVHSLTQMPGATTWLSIGPGYDHCAAISQDGKLFTWGWNYQGQLGNGNNTQASTPAQLGAATWIQASGLGSATAAIGADGTMYNCGANAEGELANGTLVNNNVLTASGQTGVVSQLCSFANDLNVPLLKAGRSQLCLTGYNAFGSIADGTTTNATAYNCGSNDWCAAYSLPNAAAAYTQPVSAAGNRTDFQHGCGLVASVMPSGANPLLTTAGNTVTAKVWKEAGVPAFAGTPYVARHYEVTPSANATAASGTVTLYFTQAEFTAYNAAPNHGLSLPADAADAANNKANLRITKKSGASSDGTGLPGTYSGANALLVPASVVWDDVNNWWAVTFSTTGFSGFFINTGSAPLPVRLLAFTAAPAGDAVRLDWQVTDQKNMLRYTVERMADGGSFSALAAVDADASTAYTATDGRPFRGRNYYRLKMEGLDGSATYSNTELVMMNNGGAWFRLSPVPAKEFVTLSTNDGALDGSLALLTDLQGRTVRQIVIKNGAQQLYVGDLQSGIYLLHLTNGQSCKVVKE